MKIYLYIFVFSSLVFNASAQYSPFSVLDLDWKVYRTPFFDKMNDSVNLALIVTGRDPFSRDTIYEKHSVLVLDNNKQVLETKVLFDSCKKVMRVFKQENNYLYVGSDYNYNRGLRYAFTSYLYDSTFNLLKDTVIFLDLSLIHI